MSATSTLPGSGKRLLWRAAWRHAARHRWQSWLSLAGIALGVMMVVAVELANSSAARAFELSVAALDGNLTHRIVAQQGAVDDTVFAALRRELGVRASAPSLRGEVLADGQRLTLIGLDPLSEAALQRRRPGFALEPAQLLRAGLLALAQPRGVLLQGDTARALGLEPGAVLHLQNGPRSVDAELAAVLDGPDAQAVEGLVFADIALVQTLLGRSGMDSIDLRVDAATAQRIAAWLPPGLTLVEAGTDDAALVQFSRAFRTNLSAMSLLALLVAALLIYNTVSLSVLERLPTFGVLRALGVAPRTLLRLVLGESAVLGLAASLVGVLLGLGLAQFLLRLVTRTMSDLYFTRSVTEFAFDIGVLNRGLLLGVGITVLAALLPALQAARVAPVSLQRQLPPGQLSHRRLRQLAGAGLALLAGGYLLLATQASLVAGFAALNLLIFGCCLLIPWLLDGALALWLRLTLRWLSQPLRLSLRNLRSSIGRSGLAVAALAVAVSVTVGVGVMIGSFRYTIEVWLDQTLGGEVQFTRLDDGAGISPTLERTVLELPGVRATNFQYRHTLRTEFGEVQAFAHRPDALGSLYLKQAPANALAAFAAGEGVLLAEPFAWLHGLAVGDVLRYTDATGDARMPVAGVYFDYTTGPGALELPLARFQALWPGQGPRQISLELTDDADRAAVLGALRRLAQTTDGNFGVAANADIEAITLAIFDRTFAITDVLRLLAIGVAFVGVLSALSAQQLQRQREYALLRAVGMDSGQVARMMLTQTLVMGLGAGLLALPLGLMMSQVLIDVINLRSFGWSMQHRVPLFVLGQAVLLALLAALLAGMYPALRLMRLSPALASRAQ
ncbi:MAG TPA: ABC transporter permease [Hyphomicrobiales bacterium]|nr:ABC transporter permease [Hyphomicrobiales bacterium]